MLKDLLIYLSSFQNLITNSNTVKKEFKEDYNKSNIQRWISERLHTEHCPCATFLTTNVGTVNIQHRIYNDLMIYCA